jgi:acyl-CoA reductase-like NAD-dependent aldehyde dehydrogenase
VTSRQCPLLAQSGQNLVASMASQINSGTVWINRHLNLQPDIPFRGDKQSGIGTELGHAGLAEYTQPRIISMARQHA